MLKPVRLRLSRAKGFDLQAHSRSVNGLECVNVGRPSIFGNPFVVGLQDDWPRDRCVELFDIMLQGYTCCCEKPPMRLQESSRDRIIRNIHSLTGKNLACWCPLDGKPCHANTLLYIANRRAQLAICDRYLRKYPVAPSKPADPA